MNSLLALLKAKKPLFIDGAMGTMLQSLGMPEGANPAEFCMERSDIVRKVHKSYLESGADIILTATFGGSKFKLPANLDVFEFNKAMAENAKEAVCEYKKNSQRLLFVAGDIGPVGQFLKPLGELEPNIFVEAIREQVRGLVAGGVDLIFIETQFDLAEARAAVAATKMECDLPIFVSMTFEDGLSLTGTKPEVYAATMENMGVAAIGVNCGAGPEQILPIVEKILASCSCPVFVEPNAGLPELIDGNTVFRLSANDFANQTFEIAKRGAVILGGCCGTTPEHIQALRQKVLADLDLEFSPRILPSGIRLTSRSDLVLIGNSQPITLIGERINPTGKKLLSAEFKENKIDLALQYAKEQIALNTLVLDVNVGAAGVNEEKLLPLLVENLVARHSCILCLDSSNPTAIINTLPIYPGSALVNSISGEENKMEQLAPHCKNWGAPFVLLPLTGSNLPSTAKERIKIIEELLLKAEKYQIPRHLIIIDVLALTAASDSLAPMACLETIAWCKQNNLPTTIGLSNISFGFPARDLVNSAFLTLAAGHGLNSCIANPSNTRIRESLDSINLLLGHDSNAEKFVGQYATWKAGENNLSNISQEKTQAKTLEEAVVLGDKDNIIAMVEKELASGLDAFSLVNEKLIPGIQIVGEKYEKKEYFLPQLLRSASTMQTAFNHVKPLLEADARTENRPKIILATVEGDIHDIGKNIVALLLSNHGFEVIDLGKDVKADFIVEKAKEHQVNLVGLSALMTTTMPRMEQCVKLLQEHDYTCPVMVGGAVVTSEYADSIGANFSADAVEAVKLAKILLQRT